MEKKKFEIPAVVIKHFECKDVINASTTTPTDPTNPTKPGTDIGDGPGAEFAKGLVGIPGKVSWD